MFTVTMLQDLYRHLEWAESVVWSTALQSPVAVGDLELRDRLYHIHLTQRVFLDLWTNRTSRRYRNSDFPSLIELYEWARPYYAEAHAFLGAIDPAELSKPTPVPWAKFFARQLGHEPEIPTLGETLFQVASHSTYHRGQVNTRLRILDIEPPLVDYIAWIWSGRPEPQWL